MPDAINVASDSESANCANRSPGSRISRSKHRTDIICAALRLWRAWARRRSWMGSRCWMRPWCLGRSWSRCRTCSWSWRWRSAAAQPGHGHCIGRTTRAGGDFTYHQHKGLAVFDVKRERCRVTGNWALPFVCYPVRADVIWIKGSQVSSRKDEIAALAIGIDIDCHALSGAGRVCERVGIVMDRSSGNGKTCTGTGAGIRKTVAVKAISLCGISIVDVSSNHGRWAGRRRSRAGRGRRRAPTAVQLPLTLNM